MSREEKNDRRFFIPEVVQTSAMDCGPASLKALLEGYGINISYGRLREACQTSVDGTSIDTLEDVANQLGLQAEQIMVPVDHLLLSSAQTLPAIIVVRHSNGLTHFVVIWSQHGKFLQVMDPGSGRRWPTWKNFVNDIYIHTFPVSAQAWRDWAGSDGFLEPLSQRMTALHMQEELMNRLQNHAVQDSGWHSLAALDASVRMVDSLIRAGGIDQGEEAAHLVERFYQHGIEQALETDFISHKITAAQQNVEEKPTLKMVIPLPYWSVQPYVDLSAEAVNQELSLLLRGAVLVRIIGRQVRSYDESITGSGTVSSTIRASEDEPAIGAEQTPSSTGEKTASVNQAPLPPELAAALEEPPTKPSREILDLMRKDGLLNPVIVILALAMSSLGVLIEAMLLQGILQIGTIFPQISQRTLAIGMFFTFFILMAFLEFPTSAAVTRIGRRLETRLRIAFLEKLPKLSDRYFHSRLISDMTQRAHELRILRMMPDIAENLLRTFFQLIFTTIGIIVLDPISAPLAVLATTFFIGLSIVTKPFLDERDLRMRTHLGALDRFYLDAMLGLIPVRTHGAERSLRREHENLLVEWVHASMDAFQLGQILQAISSMSYSIFAVWIVFNYIAKGGESSGILLLFYWTLSLPTLGQNLVLLIQQYPMHRNSILRVLEPIHAPDEFETFAPVNQMQNDEFDPVSGENNPSGSETEVNVFSPDDQTTDENGYNLPMCIEMQGVSVKAGGHIILKDIQLNVQGGEHIAVVGPSGAGKSSLIGLLLGWHRPDSGLVLVDGMPLDGPGLRTVRRNTAWVDPAIQIWNRSLLYNLQYGASPKQANTVRNTIEEADLFNILTQLPEGMQTILGENGGLLSGGEGQRVRLGRAMLRKDARLVILDEPFRGLDREKRRILLAQAREIWKDSTFFCVTHDVSETLSFSRVLVIEEGCILEDDTPQNLVSNPNSRYLSLLKAEEDVRINLWASTDWRRLWIDEGILKETK